MRNDSHKWPPSPEINAFSQVPIDMGVASLTPVALAHQTLISGPDVLNQTDAPLIGWPDITDTHSYALCLRRDRILLVNSMNTKDAYTESGWNEEKQQAISDVSDTYAVFDLTGPLALDLLSRGAEISSKTTSRSVVRLLFGLNTMIYRASREDQFRVHVAWVQRQSLIDHLQSAASTA